MTNEDYALQPGTVLGKGGSDITYYPRHNSPHKKEMSTKEISYTSPTSGRLAAPIKIPQQKGYNM